MSIESDDVLRLEQTIARGGIAILPTDTLYGIACAPDSQAAADRIYALKGRPNDKPSAVMFFSVDRLLESLPELDAPTRALVAELLPGPFTLIVKNPKHRFATACGGTPELLGLRVPALANSPLEALAAMPLPVMQTSANISGGPDATALEDIDPAIRAGVDLCLDGGPLLGIGSTVADISELAEGSWRLLRSELPRTAGRIREVTGIAPTA